MGGQSAVLGLAAASLFLSMCVLFYGMLGFSHEAGAELPSAMTAARGAAEFGLAPGVFALLTSLVGIMTATRSHHALCCTPAIAADGAIVSPCCFSRTGAMQQSKSLTNVSRRRSPESSPHWEP
jgi:hypothetical protein